MELRFLFLTTVVGAILSCQAFSQPFKSRHFENKWRIINVVGLLTSSLAEKEKVYEDCLNAIITIDSSSLLVNSNKKQCLLQTKRNFKMCFDSIMTYEEAQGIYSGKFLNVVFEQNKVDSIFLYKSNIFIENDDLGYLRMIKISYSKIIVQYLNYLFILEKQ